MTNKTPREQAIEKIAQLIKSRFLLATPQCIAEDVLKYLESLGYVQLAENQDLPNNRYSVPKEWHEIYKKAQRGSLALLELAVKLIRDEVHIRQHSGNCAIYSEPASPKGECDCGYEKLKKCVEHTSEDKDG